MVSFKYSLVRYEEATASPGETQKEDHSVDNYDRKNMVAKPIQFNELLKERSRTPGGPVATVRKVLLVCNPGTGKTYGRLKRMG